MYLSCEICYLSDSDYIAEDFELSDDSEIYYDLSELVIKYKYK